MTAYKSFQLVQRKWQCSKQTQNVDCYYTYTQLLLSYAVSVDDERLSNNVMVRWDGDGDGSGVWIILNVLIIFCSMFIDVELGHERGCHQGTKHGRPDYEALHVGCLSIDC